MNNRRVNPLTSKRKAKIAEMAISGMIQRILGSEEKKRKEDGMAVSIMTHQEAA
ncbi:MAG: hypothetical protein ABIK15_10445 [Pseudomonadota bacterium]